jgi:hypothetical protein
MLSDLMICFFPLPRERLRVKTTAVDKGGCNGVITSFPLTGGATRDRGEVLYNNGGIMNRIIKSYALGFLLLITLLAFQSRIVFAENIDPNNLGLKYAYGENVGWINFKPSQGPGVTVTSSAGTGYAWGENIGWINLNPATGGVLNDGTGKLTGYAWGENVGWINFAPTGGAVFIDEHGMFFGKAWGENIGWVSFNSSGPVSFGVATAFIGQQSQTPLAVPTLTEWGMVIMSLLLGGCGVFLLRRTGAD